MQPQITIQRRKILKWTALILWAEYIQYKLKLNQSSFCPGGDNRIVLQSKIVMFLLFQLNYSFPCCCSLAAFFCQRFFFIDSLPKRPVLSFFLSQCVNLAISQLASYDGYFPICRMYCSLFGLQITRLIAMQQELQFYKFVFAPVCRFRSSK